MTGTLNPNMIVLAREARGFNQADLAEKIGMSPTNLSKIERGDIATGSDLLETIADRTGFPLQFFYQPGDILSGNLSYRRRETVAQKLLTPINATVNIISRHVQFLSSGLDIETIPLPNLAVTDKQTPGRVAIKLRQLWSVEEPVIGELTRLLESKGIVVNGFDFGTERVDSRAILTNDKLPIIFYNKTLLGDRQRFSLAYELGQLIMHTFNAVAPERDISREANEFAAEFLMPAKHIKDDFKNGISIPLLGELKRKWKVSMISLLYRADDLGFLTPNQKRYLVQQFNQLRIRRREPVELDITPEQPKLLKQWISDYRSKTKLSTVETAAVLCLNVDEFLEYYS
jgi:Zn-dependent peptidase ImmA (M78 family)/DNA-binding XRE family transcriptional regulator